MVFADGRDPGQLRNCWTAADIFISLSDNIQETFGLTPLEAMAAGLPAVVTDWNGYKETVRDGIDGFRIPTWMPPPDLGDPFARAYEVRIHSYDIYAGVTSRTVSVDHAVLAARLIELAQNPELRRKMGEAGRARAQKDFDWGVIYGRYQELWAELGRIRAHAGPDREAPTVDAARQDPFATFGHYPTGLIQSKTRISATPIANLESYREMVRMQLFSFEKDWLPSTEIVNALLRGLANGELTLSALAAETIRDVGRTALAVSILAKMGIVRLR